MRGRLLTLLVTAALCTAAGPAHPFQADEASAPRVTIEQLKTMLAAASVRLLDVRNKEAYELGHIPGAISMPLEAIKPRLSELKKDEARPIVAYCA
jgi:3-mercaptopyruvate sulfurtransferase SseA